ncbi:MAG: F0F1 ATP synthase subunit delta [Roseburia sp. 40_7]|nr:MAG: F0F1 ATP synthase subunit delta [Roseburia sp. 40_7]
MAKLVSKTYGDALFEVAAEENRMDALLDEADGILTVLRENAGLSKVMTHPKIVKEEKLDLIDHIFKGRVSDEMVGLMRMIVEKGHFGELESVLEYFIAQVKEYKNIGIAYDCLCGAVPRAAGAYCRLQAMIRIKDRVVDSSIKTKLYDLSRELSKIQLKVGECAP